MKNSASISYIAGVCISCEKNKILSSCKAAIFLSSCPLEADLFYSTGNVIDHNFNYSLGDTFVLKGGSITYFAMSNIHDVNHLNEGALFIY
jgi:hypothetical protein